MMSLMVSIIQENGLARCPYVEPFAGGCGLALGLLFHGHVSEIHVNDVDPAIWSFWHSVLHQTEEFVDKLMSAELSVEHWRRQREICIVEDCTDPLTLGFSAFYLNRTNRSGIIKGAGLIGGIEQNGAYKLDCRYNREDLANRIRRVGKYRDRIHLSRLDAIDFLVAVDHSVSKKAMFCIDPPYFKKGSSLYTSFYRPNDHVALARTILKLERPWIVTYDNVPEINALYSHQARFTFDVNYSVQTKRTTSELLVVSDGLALPFELDDRQIA